MSEFFKAAFTFIQVILYITGVFTADTTINYGGEKHSPPEISVPMKIVENGASDFFIVTEDTPDETILTAVSELQTYVEKISGASLKAVKESQYSLTDNAIIIGNTIFDDDIKDINTKTIKQDGFVLYSDGAHLFIYAENSRGALYGVYTFLEEYLGVRWFTPELEVVPETADIIIDAAIRRIVEPSFSIRRNDCIGTNDAHRARTKMNVSFWNEATEYGGALNYVLWDVTLDKLVPDELITEHPDYFATTAEGTKTRDHVCLSNPDVLNVAIQNARKAILECERDANYIHIGQKDNTNYCRCERCEALYEKYGSVSAPTILFTNAFADALDDEFPDFMFTFYAYNETDRPPTDMSLRCNKNVAPVLCGLHKACRSHPLTECGAQDGNETFYNLFGDNEPTISEDFKNWVKIADTTYIYDYTINFINTAQFFSNFEYMQSTMKYMHDIGITGYIYNCGDTHIAAFNELRNYLLCKIQWDVNCDVEYHMMDFLKAYYGEEAAPYIKQIIDIQTAQTKASAHAFDFDWHYQAGFYPMNVAVALDGLWDKALNANITEEQLFNVETANLSWEYFKANQFLDKYTILNPFRHKRIEELYDLMIEHGITEVSGFKDIPPKEEINFMQRPFNWG